jgi:shikimate dehydrogenase
VAAADAAGLYAVVGNPVSHSLSPRIHARFAEQTGDAISYQAIELPLDGFEAGVRDLRRRGYAGLNVTVPFKREAWAICEQLSPRARDAGAVNTLSLGDEAIAGDNTDGAGLLRDLVDNLGLELESRHILLLGAGGAARGAIAPLLALSPGRLVIANRSVEKAAELARDFADRGHIEAAGYPALGESRFDLVVNATSAGLAADLPPVPVSAVGPATVCYDMMYDLAGPTAFVAWARGLGAALACDGLGMLVEQAAESFRVWRGARPDSGDVIRMLRPVR